jgi:transketolase
MAEDERPNYVRLARGASPIITTQHAPFQIGPAYTFREGSDVTIVATGTMTYQALVAAELLKKDGISAEVIHVPTIKPFDAKTIVESARKTGAVVTAEEGQVNGGLGGAVAEALGEHHPVPLRRIGMQDQFGESAKTPEELLKHFGLDAPHIVLAAHSVIGRK